MFVCFFFKPPLKYRTESRWLERSVVGDRGKESRTSVVDRGKQQQEGSVLTKVKPSDMLFKPISASICKSRQGTLGGGCNSLSPSLLSFIPPSSISLSSDLASGFCPHVCYLIPLLDSFHLMIFSHLSPSKCQSFSLAMGHDPSLFMSLPVYRWVRVSLSCPSICLSVRPSVFSSVHTSVWVCPSVGVGGWEAGPGGASLPAWLLIQYLCGVVHLCEALRSWAGARTHFLWLLELHQDVPDLPLSTLQEEDGIQLMQAVNELVFTEEHFKYFSTVGEKYIQAYSFNSHQFHESWEFHLMTLFFLHVLGHLSWTCCRRHTYRTLLMTTFIPSSWVFSAITYD